MPELTEWKFRKKKLLVKQAFLQMIMNKLAYETYEKVSRLIAIGDLFWNGDRDRDRDLKFDQDRDRDRNFRDRGHALVSFNNFLQKESSKNSS